MAAILLGPGAQKVERFHKINCWTSLCFLSNIFECKRTLKKCIIFRLHLPEDNHQAIKLFSLICLPRYVQNMQNLEKTCKTSEKPAKPGRKIQNLTETWKTLQKPEKPGKTCKSQQKPCRTCITFQKFTKPCKVLIHLTETCSQSKIRPNLLETH